MKMHTRLIPSAMIAAICVLGPALAETTAEDDPEPTTWRVIESGAYSHIEEATRTVIQSQEDWHKWWIRHNTITEHIDGKEIKPAPPPVDFTEESVLTATMGRRSTGGYAIEFVRIHHEGDTLVATLHMTAPGPEDMVTMALTAPYTIIAIPKHEGPIRFVENERR